MYKVTSLRIVSERKLSTLIYLSFYCYWNFPLSLEIVISIEFGTALHLKEIAFDFISATTKTDWYQSIDMKYQSKII